MSQARGAARRQTQQIYELGQAGRKTGVILPDNGQRDENGLQPLDGLFSSPTKPDGSTPRAVERSIMGEQDMEIDQASSPGPSTIMRNRRSGASALPISRSPVRTSLGSPALKNPHLTSRPSPARPASRLRGYGDSATTTAPTVTASAANKDNPQTISRNLFAVPKAQHRPRPNGTSRSRRFFPESDEDEDDDDVLQPPAQGDIFDESMQMIEEFIPQSDAPQLPDDEEGQQEPTPRPTKRFNRSSGETPNKLEPLKPSSKSTATAANNRGPLKRLRQSEPEPQSESDENTEEQEEEESMSSPSIQAPVDLPPPNPPRRQASRSSQSVPPTKPPPTTASKPTSSASATKARVKPSPAQTLNRKARVSGRSKKTAMPKSSAATGSNASNNDDNDNDAGDKSLLEVQRGPPPPKRRGLMSVRTNDNITTTRSGRTSYAPLQFWKGERAEIATETFRDTNSKQAFVLAATKEIIRVEDDDPPASKRRRAARPAGRRAASAAAANISAKRVASGSGAGELLLNEPLEEWERDPGVVDGDVVLWTYEHEINPPGPDEEVGIITEQLAISGGAVETREIKDATFRYAKTMSLGFMGSGIVDLPPGSEKRPKNSRRMQLVFFVASGKVKVTIHDNEFRIGAGGQFFVPRGNYYSIVNDYDSPARIFFAQACEMEMQQYEEGEEAEEMPEDE
ncbi:mitotic fidelity of chromosome transmission-related protein [Ceratocystis pirilliformis]|uniref:Mitotic fidelity of chromosome transmission-related protein n=1 Tax=Ceratocystis pirilliformis TaxID=259994 RepID=A0ABR3Z5T3_9PEZI